MNYGELQANVQDIVENAIPAATLAMLVRQAEQKIYNTVQFASLRKNVTGNLTLNNKYLAAPGDFLSVYSLAVIKANGEYVYLLNKDVNFIREAYPSPTATGLPKHYAIFGPAYSDLNELSFILGPTPNSSYDVELHYYYYPTSIVQSSIATFGAITAGSSYTNGTYFNVPLTGGSGSGATARVVVSGGAVTSVTLQNPGVFYAVGNTLSAAASSIGGTGSGFSIPVATVDNATGTSWLGDNFDTVLLNGTLIEAIRFIKGEQETVQIYETLYAQAIALAKQLGDGKQRMDAYRDGQVRVQVK
jgi:hypothetical protein